MAADFSDVPPIEEPLAELERWLIDDFVHSAGYDPVALRGRADEEAKRVLTAASIYAATRLTEVESRAHYIRDLRHSD